MDEIEKQIYKYSENDMDTLRAMLNGSHKANKFLQALADKRLELLKAAPVTQPYMRASDIDQWFDDYDEWRARVAEAIDASA